MTPSQLKEHILSSKGKETHFFDRETMRFFGDKMANFGVRRVRVSYGDEVNPQTGRYELQECDAWELYRRRPVKHGLHSSHYFRADNFRQIHCIKGVTE